MDSQQETKLNPPFATASGMPSFNREQARQERDDLELMKNLQLFTELVQEDGSTVFDVEGVLVDAPTGCQLALRKRPQQFKNNERIPLIREYARQRAKAEACDEQTFGPTRFERSSSDRILVSGEKTTETTLWYRAVTTQDMKVGVRIKPFLSITPAQELRGLTRWKESSLDLTIDMYQTNWPAFRTKMLIACGFDDIDRVCQITGTFASLAGECVCLGRAEVQSSEWRVGMEAKIEVELEKERLMQKAVDAGKLCMVQSVPQLIAEIGANVPRSRTDCERKKCHCDRLNRHDLRDCRRCERRKCHTLSLDVCDDCECAVCAELTGQCGFDPKFEMTSVNAFNDALAEYHRELETVDDDWKLSFQTASSLNLASLLQDIKKESPLYYQQTGLHQQYLTLLFAGACGMQLVQQGDRELTGQSRIGKGGLFPKSFTDAASAAAPIVAAVGMANPSSGIEGAEEGSKPEGDEAFDPGTVTMTAVASEIQMAADVVADTISAQFTEMKLLPAVEGYKSEVDRYAYDMLFAKPMIAATWVWNTTQATGTEVGAIQVPQFLKTLDNLQTSTLKQHAFMRFKTMIVTGHINCNVYTMGWGRLASIGSEYYTDSSSNYNRAITSSGADINASVMTQPLLQIPICFNQSWIPTKIFWQNSMKQCNWVAFYVILPLMGVEGDSPSLPIRITVQFEGLELACPVKPMTNADLFQPWVPRGRELTGQSGPEKTSSVVYYPRSNAFANYEEGTEILKNVTGGATPQSLIQTTEDAMDINMLMSKPGIMAYFPITTDMEPGNVIYTRRVTPIQDSEYARPTTPLAYFARWGVRWRGALRYKWMIAKNVFSTCKVAIVQMPLDHTYTLDTDYMNYNHVIFDLKEDSLIEFEMSFLSDHPTLRVPHLFGPMSGGYNEGGVTFGSQLVIILHTKLQTNATMQSTLNTALWVSAGTGFTLYNIHLPDYTAATDLVLNMTNASNIRIKNFTGEEQWLVTANTVIEGGQIAEGPYTAVSLITVNLGAGPVSSGFNWTGNVVYAQEFQGTMYITNRVFPVGGSESPIAREVSGFPVTIRPGGSLELTGQSGITSAMHDKSQKEIPMIGTSSLEFDIPMKYEPLTSLLQILERPHAINVAPGVTFVNRTAETVDAFEMFSQCFAYTTGSVQWMVIGADVIANPYLDPTVPNIRASYIQGGVKMPVEDGHVLLVDSPPMTDALVCMNVAGSYNDLILDARTQLTGVAIVPRSEDVNVEVYVRAGQGFEYHYWCGIPTPEQQTRTLQKTSLQQQTTLNVASSLALEAKIQQLREHERNRIQKELTGQMNCDDDQKNWKNPGKQSSESKILGKLKTLLPGKTESHVVADHAPGNPFEGEEDDDVEDEYLSVCSETDSSKPRTKIPTSRMIPKPVHAALQSVADTAHSIDQNSTDMKFTFRDIRNDIAATREAVKKTSARITSTCDRATDAIVSTKQKFHDKMDEIRQDIKHDGLFSMLFGKESAHSKIIQILLVDALECVTIRSKAKWIGMLVKIGISMGLTNKLVGLVMKYFRERTSTEVTPTENHQGDATGQAFGDQMPLICSIVSVLIMFGAFALSGGTHVDGKKLPTMWDWAAERGRQAFSLDRGVESMFKFFDKVNKWVVKAVKKFMPLNDVQFKCLQEEEFLKLTQKIVKDVTPLLEVKQQVRIFADANLRKLVVSVDRLYAEWWVMTTDPEISRKHSSLTMRIERLIKDLRARIISIIDTPSVRIDPYHISFFGGSGLGKSYLASVVAYVLGKSQNVPTEDLFYPRCPDMEFWDNYHCQEFVGIDDVDQIDDQEQAGELIQLKSNVPKVLPMAHLETKGAMFSSRGMITTTNVAYPEPKAIKCKLAYKRRRNVLVECIAVEESQAFDLSHFRFVFRDPTDSTRAPLSEQMNFHELMFELAVGYSQYLKVQHRLVRGPCPDNVFKPLYVYSNTDESRLKVYELCQEIMSRTSDETDQYMRDISEIVTNWSESEIVLPPAKEGVPTDFNRELKLVKKKKLTVQDEKSPSADSDEEDEFFEDEIRDMQGEEEHYSEPDDELTGQMDCPKAHSSKQDPFEIARAMEVREQQTELRVRREAFKKVVDETGLVTAEVIEPETKAFIQCLPVPNDESVLPLNITQEFVDVVHTLTGGALGSNYRELPDELPTSACNPEISGVMSEMSQKYMRFRQVVRSMRTELFKDESDEIFYDKFWFCLRGYLYFCGETEKDDLTNKQRTLACVYCGYFAARMTWLIDALLGHQLKLGLASRVMRNLNNRILPNSLTVGLGVEGYRTFQEVCFLPFSMLTRVIWECGQYILRGLKYIAKTIYTSISEQTPPEYHTLMKVGLFLIGGFLIYQVAGRNTMLKKGWNRKAAVDAVVQADLLGESSEGPNLTPQILTRLHIGMPDDGAPYKHFHQCERCRLIYAHAHVKTSKSPQFQLLCKRCTVAQQNLYEEAKKKGTCDVDAPMVEGVEIAGSDLVGEAVASSGGALKERFQKRMKLRGESNQGSPPIASKSWKDFFRVYDINKQQPQDLTGHASDDPQALQMIPSIKRNCASFSIGGRSVNVLFLGGRWAVTVYHVIALAQGKEMPYYIDWKGEKFPGLLDTYVDTRPCPTVELFGTKLPEDCVFINFRMNKTLPQFRDIRHHIPSSEEFNLIDGADGLLLVKNGHTSDFTHLPTRKIGPMVDRTITTPSPNLKDYSGPRVRTAVALAWEYRCDTESGSCGSPLIAKNPGLTHKLVAFHIASLDGSTYCYGFPLFREMVDRMIGDQELVGQCEVEDIKRNCSEWYECFPKDLPSEHTLKYVPQGRVLILGKLDKQHEINMPRKTDIVASPYKDQIYYHTTEPAILTDMDPRSPGDIIQRGIDKFGKICHNKRPRRIMEKVIAHRVKVYERERHVYTGPLRTLTEDEVINGVRGQKFIPPLRMDTSPGYPYVKLRPSGCAGRKFLFEELQEEREPGVPKLKAGPLLRRHLDEIWGGLLEGKIKWNYFVDTLKDERRSHHRLYKTRFFNVHNVAWLIVWKRLFGAHMAMKLTARFNIGSGLGMDTHGPEVTVMMSKLLAVGDKFLMTDVAEWDGTRQAETLDDAMEANIRFMRLHENDPDNNRRREMCKHAQAHRIHIVESTVYMTMQGVPSGRGDTSDINTDDHIMENEANWLELAEHWVLTKPKHERERCIVMATLEAKEEHTCEQCVGDDGGGTVSDEAVEFYNEINIEHIFAHYGTKCTPPNKVEGQEIKAFATIEEFEFLKSTFRRDENFRMIWHMQMSPKVIRELTNWVTVHGDPYQLFYSNMEDALRFAYHHGKEFYNQFRTDVNCVLKRDDQPQLTTRFEESREEFLEKFDKFLLYPST